MKILKKAFALVLFAPVAVLMLPSLLVLAVIAAFGWAAGEILGESPYSGDD